MLDRKEGIIMTPFAGIRGRVEVIKKDAMGNVIDQFTANTINNSLKEVFARLLRYGSADAANFPSFAPTRMKLSDTGGCYGTAEEAAQATTMCGTPFEIPSGADDVLALSDDYKYIETGQTVHTSEVRFGIVIPMNYEFIVNGTQTDTYTIAEAGLFADIGGTEKMIAWTSFGTPISKAPEEVLAIIWIIQIS